MTQSKSRIPLLPFVILVYAPVLLGYILLAVGVAINILIMISEADSQFTIFLAYLVGLFLAPALIIFATYQVWKKTSNGLWRGASLYFGLSLLSGIVLFFIMESIAGTSMAVVDGSVADVRIPAFQESLKWLLCGQAFILPWSIGAAALFQRNYSKA
jgi:hypothetical protein